jgi:hypothetical protein
MSIQPQAINEFIERKVKDGSCHSILEAEKEIISQLIDRDIERQIKIGDEQIENGEYEILDDNYIDRFIARMAKKHLPQNV